ncbi:hypothetical protein ACP4OV_004166 [Aristida adscensionis]
MAMASTGTTPMPPPSESTTTTDSKQLPLPRSPSIMESDAPPRKRKLEEVGFHQSPYYKIRETIANLRAHFIQVYPGTDSQKNDAAIQILKDVKAVMELSKETRLDLSFAAEPVKPPRISKDKLARKIPSVLKNNVPPKSLAENFVHDICENVSLKPDNSENTSQRFVPVDIKEGGRPRDNKLCEATSQDPSEVSYVIGGSPIGWNFLMWPGSKEVYYGFTKAQWLAHQYTMN